MSGCDRDMGDFHSQDFKISMFADGMVVETIVGIC